MEVNMMAAQGAVLFLVQKIDSLFSREWNLIEDTKANIVELKLEMETIKDLLRRTCSAGACNNETKVWINQVRDLAYDIEDVFEKFEFHVPHRSKLLFGEKHSAATSVQEIMKRTKNVREIREKYNYLPSSSSHNNEASPELYRPRMAPLYEADDVGIEKPRSDLMAWARRRQPNRLVMFVVGFGGSGKTFLANQVYQQIKQEFDFCAWIPVFGAHNRLDILKTMWKELSKSTHGPVLGQSGWTDEYHQTNQLRSFLRDRSYLVVVDELGNENVWETIKCALPEGSFGRVIVTTTRGDIANLSCHDPFAGVYNHQLLLPIEDEKLFRKKAFPSKGEVSETLSKLSDLFLKQCEGSPLAIVSIGNLLSRTERTKDAWMQLHDSLGSELQTSRLSNIRCAFYRTLIGLPCFLMYCLLYFAIFPEGHQLRRRKLIRMWATEGLLQEIEGKTPEQIGDDNLEELIQRKLVLVDEFDFNGRAKFCHVHRLHHKILLSMAYEENFFKDFKHLEQSKDAKVRRLSIHEIWPTMTRKFSAARTLLAFQPNETSSDEKTWRPSGKTVSSYAEGISKFSILKILDLEAAPLSKFPDAIVDLVFLRYLSLRNTNIEQLPRSISQLQNLEILDLKHTLVTKLRSKVFQLKKLRHLSVCRYNIQNYVSIRCVQGCKVSKKIGNLESLQKVSFIKANEDKMISALQKLTKLRKLGILDLKEKNGYDLCQAIQKMTSLRSLDLSSSTEEEYLDLTHMQSPPEHLQRLYLKGRLWKKLPDFVTKLHDLQRIRLKWSRLPYSPIDALQQLPNLMELQLLDAYTGERLYFPARKFQNLKILELERLRELTTVTMDNETLANLQTLIFRKCESMTIVPQGIQQLPVLKSLSLYDMSETFVSSMNSLVGHIPHICIYQLADNGIWMPRELA